MPENRPSLPEVHRSIKIPHSGSFWRKTLAYAGLDGKMCPLRGMYQVNY